MQFSFKLHTLGGAHPGGRARQGSGLYRAPEGGGARVHGQWGGVEAHSVRARGMGPPPHPHGQLPPQSGMVKQ